RARPSETLSRSLPAASHLKLTSQFAARRRRQTRRGSGAASSTSIACGGGEPLNRETARTLSLLGIAFVALSPIPPPRCWAADRVTPSPNLSPALGGEERWCLT